MGLTVETNRKLKRQQIRSNLNDEVHTWARLEVRERKAVATEGDGILQHPRFCVVLVKGCASGQRIPYLVWFQGVLDREIAVNGTDCRVAWGRSQHTGTISVGISSWLMVQRVAFWWNSPTWKTTSNWASTSANSKIDQPFKNLLLINYVRYTNHSLSLPHKLSKQNPSF